MLRSRISFVGHEDSTQLSHSAIDSPKHGLIELEVSKRMPGTESHPVGAAIPHAAVCICVISLPFHTRCLRRRRYRTSAHKAHIRVQDMEISLLNVPRNQHAFRSQSTL